MTKVEVENLIEQELHRALGKHGIQINLRETDSQRQAREQRVKEAEQRAKAQRKDEKRILKESARSFRALCGFTKEQAKEAAKANARRYRG
jgi:hypothetical protein